MTFRKTALWILAAGLLIALILAYPAYKEIRLWRANQMAQQAEEMLTSPETLSRAWELAHAANALNPDDAEIARVLAKVYSASDPIAAYDFWQHVVELSSGNPDDQLELARAYLNAKKWEEFDAEILKQRKAELHPRELDYLETLAAMLQGKFTDAFRMATELVAQEDTPEAADALFFQMTQRSADAATRRAGIDNLWKIASGQDPREQQAIQTLASLRELSASDIQRLIETIQNRPDNDRGMELLVEELRLRLKGTDSLASYERARELFHLDDPVEMAEFGRWLNQHGLHHYTNRVIPLERAVSRQDLFLIHVDAMALENQWEAISQLLNRPRLPLEDYLKAFFQARALIEIGNDRSARLAWDRALIEASRKTSKLYFLALKARQLGLDEFEILALQRVIESPEMRERAMRELIELLQRKGRTSELYTTMLSYVSYFPRDKSAENDTLYLGFLTGKASPDSVNQAKRLLESEPTILAYRMTLALGLLRKNRATEAVKLLDRLPVNWFEMRDRWRLIAAVALYRNGFEVDAQKLISGVDSSNLLPEEQVFLTEIDPKRR